MIMERQPQNFKRSGRAHLLLGIVLMFTVKLINHYGDEVLKVYDVAKG